MIPRDAAALALRNLKQAKVRTFLTTLGVAIGIASLSGMVSLGVGLQEQFLSRFMRSGLFNAITVLPVRPSFGPTFGPGAPKRPKGVSPKSETPLDDQAIGRFAALGRVTEVYPNMRVLVEVRYGKLAEMDVAAGIPMSARGEGIFQKISHGSFFPSDTGNTCMLSLDFAQRLDEKNPGSLIGQDLTLGYATSPLASGGLPGGLPSLTIQRAEQKFRIVGIVEHQSGPGLNVLPFSAVMIPLGKAKEFRAGDLGNAQSVLLQTGESRSYGAVTVRVKRPQDTDDVEKKIKEMGYAAFSLNDALAGARRAFILLDITLGLIGSIALAVATLGIANTMVMSILERTREIGIMKAIGGSDGDIRKIFLVEAAIIGIAGGLFGIVLGWLVGKGINFGANAYIRSQGGEPGQLFSIPWWLISGGIAFSIVASLLAGSVPAARAARLDPIRALRHD
jgi:putative ABC transport system permease protein